MNNKLSYRILATGALLLASGVASATTHFAFTNGGNSTTQLHIGGRDALQRNYTGVSVTGWAATRNSVGDASAEFNLTNVVSFGNSGIGVQQSGEGSADGQHALDNVGTNEFVLLSFANPIALTDLQIGWPSQTDTRDTDFTILAYTGAGNTAGSPTQNGFQLADMNLLNSDPADNGPSNLANQTYGLTRAGWELIGSPTDVPTGPLASIGNTNFKSSSFWLVGTRNRFLAPGSDGHADFGKLVAVKGCTAGTPGCGGGGTPGVPEPSSLALLGIGLLGTVKRWRKKA